MPQKSPAPKKGMLHIYGILYEEMKKPMPLLHIYLITMPLMPDKNNGSYHWEHTVV